MASKQNEHEWKAESNVWQNSLGAHSGYMSRSDRDAFRFSLTEKEQTRANGTRRALTRANRTIEGILRKKL